jgi:hypothetical protein
MAEWIYFTHPPRENLAAAVTEEEREICGLHLITAAAKWPIRTKSTTRAVW